MSSSLTNHNTHGRVHSDIGRMDAGIIRCICPSIEDDGFTIQCENCYVWQHAYCVNITHANIPDHYLCDRCANRSTQKPSTSSLMKQQQQPKKGPKMSKRIPMTKRKLHRLDAIVEEDSPQLVNETKKKKKRPIKSKVVSRFVHSIFKEARDRWMSNQRWREYLKEAASAASNGSGPLLYDHGPFVSMDATTLYTKGVLLNTPVSSKGLFAIKPIPALRYLLEVTGNIMLKSEFKFDPTNDYVILGTPLSNIMFYPTLDLCIDTCQFGNKARYIRRSCYPNAEMRNVILPYAKDDKTIHLGLFARRAIEKGEEITVGWNWQRGHIAWKENMNWHYRLKEKSSNENQVIDEEEERRRKTTLKALLTRFEKEFGACACVNKRKCLIQYLKRQCVAPKESAQRRKSSMPSITIAKNDRRKSSVILLKPKPSSNSNTDLNSNIITVKKDNKELSEDEFLDVEGDIDIGEDEASAIATAPPLTEDNSGEEDHDDLSSLSSLSSLSVYDDSENETSGTNIEKKKSIRNDATKDSLKRKAVDEDYYPNKSSKTATDESANRTISEAEQQNSPTPKVNLPRKKLWMLNYMTATQITQSHDSLNPSTGIDEKEDEQSEDLPEHKGLESSSTQQNSIKIEEQFEVDVVTVPSPASSPSNNEQNQTDAIEPGIMDQLESNNNTVAVAISEKALSTKSEPNTSSTSMEQLPSALPMASSYKEAASQPTNIMDIDDGELSDASTVQLDDEEIKEIYHKNDTADRPSAEPVTQS